MKSLISLLEEGRKEEGAAAGVEVSRPAYLSPPRAPAIIAINDHIVVCGSISLNYQFPNSLAYSHSPSLTGYVTPAEWFQTARSL